MGKTFVGKSQLKDWFGSHTTSGPLGIDVVPKLILWLNWRQTFINNNQSYDTSSEIF